MFLDSFLYESLVEPRAVVAYQVSRRLAALFPDRHLLEGDDYDFDLMEFARAGLCVLRPEATLHGQVATAWDRDRQVVVTHPRQIWYEVDWQGRTLDILLMFLDESCTPTYWILAESESAARAFFEAVCRHDSETRDEILVFEGGRWQGRARLFQDIRGSRFDGLVLAGGLKDEIRSDVERFFASRATYGALGAPWRRGLLFTGPPGNGKTHTIKALINELSFPCLYVRNLQSEDWTEATSLRRVFEQARRKSPCVLVLEDLDALLTDQTRSAFLNELDGFAANTGILTLATTNHPERLDPAIVDRPSRFDRTYHFGLPGIDARRAYLEGWSAALPEPLRLNQVGLMEIAERTSGFSFAYLKELCLSAILVRAEWESRACDGASGSLEHILLNQAGLLQAQMVARTGVDGSIRVPTPTDHSDALSP